MPILASSEGDDITDPFSERRKAMLLDFANVTGSHSADEIGNVWDRYYEDRERDEIGVIHPLRFLLLKATKASPTCFRFGSSRISASIVMARSPHF